MTLTAFHTLAIRIANVRLYADAARIAHAIQALLGYLGHIADHERQRGVTVGHAVHSGATIHHQHFMILVARWDWWHHHERSWSWCRALFFRHAQAIGTGTDVATFAGATGDADAWTDRVGFLARAIATFALTEFFIGLANLRLNGDGFGGGNTASFGWNTHALFAFQIAWLAEATNDALATAQWTGVRIGAGRSAGGAARHEDLVFQALAHFWWISEEHGWFSCLALFCRHAGTAGIPEVP